MRRRVIGGALTILGVLSLLFAPEQVDYSVRAGLSYGSYSFWQLIQWPPGWSWAFLPMMIIGVAFVLSGIVLMGGVGNLRRRLLGAAVATVGVVAVLFAPAYQITCGDCTDLGSYSFWQLIRWPAGWTWAYLPMLIIGVVLVVSGMLLMSKARPFS
jgi:hypothetical protein